MAVTNIGVRPTVSGQGLTIEPWLLDYDGDLYGQRITLELWHFLRGEQRFPSLEALQAEIHRNASQTRAFLQRIPHRPYRREKLSGHFVWPGCP